MAEKDPRDRKGLIREAFRIPGIKPSECRTIFLDWALDRPGQDLRDDVRALLAQYANEPADHPMTLTLQAALSDPPDARRRGGRAGRMVD